MKPLLPRTDSYLVPIQLPLTPSLLLPSTSPMSLSTPPHPQSSSTPRSGGGGRRVRIAPKVKRRQSTFGFKCLYYKCLTPVCVVKDLSNRRDFHDAVRSRHSAEGGACVRARDSVRSSAQTARKQQLPSQTAPGLASHRGTRPALPRQHSLRLGRGLGRLGLPGHPGDGARPGASARIRQPLPGVHL